MHTKTKFLEHFFIINLSICCLIFANMLKCKLLGAKNGYKTSRTKMAKLLGRKQNF